MVVSFGVRNGALLWKQDTACPYPLLLDTERQIYRMLGFQKSVRRVWCTESLIYYAEQKMAGLDFPKPYADIADDPHQLGGNIVMDSVGKIIYHYASKSASDRPAVTDILINCQ